MREEKKESKGRAKGEQRKKEKKCAKFFQEKAYKLRWEVLYMETFEQFLMNPDNEAWTYEGALRALEKLSKRYGVKAEFEEELGDLGFGLEESWYLKGNREDVFSLIDDFEEWARQFSSGTSKITR